MDTWQRQRLRPVVVAFFLATLAQLPGARAEGQAQLPKPDQGIFSNLDAQVRLYDPTWLARKPCWQPQSQLLWQVHAGLGVFAQPGPPAQPAPAICPPMDHADGDQLPDLWDILIGAKKTALDNAPYGSPYRQLAYPGGDVPRSEGVCTDVVIRALRNAGMDLQQLLREDIARAPQAYPMVRKANPNIDHRRVKTLLPYFRRHWQERDPGVQRIGDWLPGEVVFMDTLPAKGPDHIGVISDRLGPSGKPLVINSWTDGYRTAEMDLLAAIPVTHRFRPPRDLSTELPRALRLLSWQAPAETRQLVLVQAASAGSTQGTLTRWQRDGAGWQVVGAQVAVDLGRAGLAWGRGLLQGQAPQKREGDGRSPLGVFALGTAFGRGARPVGVAWPWRRTGPDDRWIDDSRSPLYNRWTSAALAGAASAEVLARPDGLYDLALVVEHNTAAVVAGGGSAIFLHVSSGQPTSGCTALAKANLLELLRWLKPAARPLLIQVADL